MIEFAVTILLPSGNERSHALDVIVSADEHHTVSDLSAALSRAVGGDPELRLRVGAARRAPGPDTPLSALDIRDGDIVELVSLSESDIDTDRYPDRPSDDEIPSGVAIEVIGGPDAGRRVGLPTGVYGVGSWAESASGPFARPLKTPAPETEDDSIVVTVREDGDVEVAPGADPTATVNGADLIEPVEVAPADVIRVGGRRFVIRSNAARQARWSGGPGQIQIHRTPSRCAAMIHEFPAFGPIPDLPARRRFGLVTIVAPIILGVGMYLVTDQAMFLMMVALSPIMAIGSAIEDRRSGRRDARKRVDEYEDLVVRRRDDYAAARARERLALAGTLPDLVEVERRAAHMTTGLWCRQRSNEDSIRVRVGVGRPTTSFAVEVEAGGDDALRDQALEAFDGLDQLDEGPIGIDLIADPVVAIVGADADVDGLLAAVVSQLAVLFSPEDVQIAAALGPARAATSLKWLPHLRSQRRLMRVGPLARDPESGRRLIAAANELVDDRLAASDHHDEPPQWPRLVLVIDAALRVDRAEVDRLLTRSPAAGVSVVWLGANATDVVSQATRVVELGWGGQEPVGRLWSADGSADDRSFTPEGLTPERADRIARALAPIRDAGTPGALGTIPASVSLWNVLEVDRPTPDWVQRQWSRADRSNLIGRFGCGVDGPVVLDLVAQGPHALIGGTSGSGKSELLQAIVAGLAVAHPPHHLNFLFIDYKGGASTQVFERLPHTVGTVSNLNPALAARALRSLRAELDHRMRVLDGRAKDLDDLARIDPDAPPRLVIMVDEFATLVKEIPEFVAGIVDIAQRGRSLGIHLVLATQRPAGSVNDNILANTNLRLALRCLDRSDSSAIIDVPDAAAIGHDSRGRLLMRRGPHELVEVQTGYGGAVADLVVDEPIRVGVFVAPDDAARFAPLSQSGAGRRRGRVAPTEQGRSQLDVTIDEIVSAADGISPPRRPWCEPLADIVSLGSVARRFPDTIPSDGRYVVGLADLPDEQAQAPFVVDLVADGGLLVFGSASSGKTQLLRSMAATAPKGTTVVALDGGSKGLAMLEPLPWVAGVAASDEVEALTRWIAGLRAEIERRRRRGVRSDDDSVLLLIDDWASVLSALDESSPTGPIWSDRLQQLIVDGRAVRVHTVVTADRRAAFSSRLQSALGGRLVLRHADRSAYLDYGIASDVAKTLELPSGRGLYDDTLVQIGTLGDDPSPETQRRRIATLADNTEPARRCVSATPLPDEVVASGDAVGALGVADITGKWVTIEPGRSPLAVVGAAGSGRSTTLATVAAGAAADGWTVVLLGAADSGLADLGPVDAVRGFGPADVQRVCATLQASGTERLLVVVDDADRLDSESSAAVDSLVGLVTFVAGVDTRAMTGFSMCALLDELRRSRRLVVLQPGDTGELLQLTGMRVDIRPGVAMPPGRGVLINGASSTLVQVATPATAGRTGRRTTASAFSGCR